MASKIVNSTSNINPMLYPTLSFLPFQITHFGALKKLMFRTIIIVRYLEGVK